ncbi:HopJ type III effector protein [Algoriphagus mannitolivorans]|uniref:HopJ type III effector protein n=1 Tax=Algoriphagus mannitolivorans TaxID=226504 RepID=UPI00041400EF|nr:HopJ type III effector protein [Algoriphagus mannitolivorans]
MDILAKLKSDPQGIQFSEVISYIDEKFDFTPTRFTNGNAVNEAGQNNGSCKIFSFARLNKLSKDETLAIFGDFFRIDVLENPEGTDHQNIRNFMIQGWDGIQFDGEALKEKGV